MITTYTFGKKNNNKNIFSFSSSKPNYSKTLDNIIIADVIKKNSYLYGPFTKKANNDAIIFDSLIGINDHSLDLDKAIKFLANYKKYKTSYKLPYIFGKMYTLTDGTPIVFYDDEIQIGFDSYKYSDFSDFSFLSGLSANTKKTIINIYTNGAKNIDINIL